MTTTNTLTPSRKLRVRWLKGGSAIAAAAALAAMAASPAHAQSRPTLSGTGAEIMMQRGFDQSLLNVGATNNAARGNVPVVRPNPQTNAPPLANSQINTVARPATTPVSIAPAPNVPTIRINQSQPHVRATVPSGPSSETIRTIPGVNVRAEATFDDVDVAFRPGVGSDVVELFASAAIIDWRTFDAGTGSGDVTFLASGDNLNFTSDLGSYTVLNRITTPGVDTAIRIDGNVTSNVFSSSITGGDIWFYSPGGIVIGSSARFDIGSLLLSTSEIDPNDVIDGSFAVEFLGTPVNSSAITIESGAFIQADNAFSNSTYVAMVAPQINQNGVVLANGSVAYVAAEEARMTIQNNLFDISVGVGTEVTDAVTHTGRTSGDSSTGQLDEQAIYFVAVPKNEAVTMLVSGEVGYASASAATIENGNLILTTGARVERRERTIQVRNSNGTFRDEQISENFIDTTVDGGPAGNIILDGVNLRTSAEIFAEGDATLRATGVGNPTSISTSGTGDTDLTVRAGNSISLEVSGDSEMFIAGDLNLIAGDGVGNGGDISIDVNATGSTVASTAGFVFVTGNLTADTSAFGLEDSLNVANNGGTGIGGDAVAGNIDFQLSDGGFLDIGGNLNLITTASGGLGTQQNGSATAGSVTFGLGEASLSIAGAFNIDADAPSVGNGTSTIASAQGSDSISGDVTISLTGGSLDIGSLVVDNRATASGGSDMTIAQSNDATAGDFTLDVTGGFHFINSLTLFANSNAAQSFDSAGNTITGIANRSNVTINVANSDTGLEFSDDVFISTSGSGGSATETANSVNISVENTGFGTGSGLIIGGDLSVGAGISGQGSGPTQRGGDIAISVDNGQFITGGLGLSANSFSGSFVTGPDTSSSYIGGDISLTSTNDGFLTVTGFTDITTEGTGAANQNSTALGLGQGGTVTILADGGSISFGNSVDIAANGFAFSGTNADGVGATGMGGTVRITVQQDGGSLTFADLDAGTNGDVLFDGEVFDTNFQGEGSTGIGGLTEFNVLGGLLTANDINVSSDGIGGPGGDAPNGEIDPVTGFERSGDGGAGSGGNVVFNLNGGDATLNNLSVTANGSGGFGGQGQPAGSRFGFGVDISAGDGGSAEGGAATFNAIAGTLTVTDTLSVEATSGGGFGGFAQGSDGGDGGSAMGGEATFNLDGTATINAPTVVVSTQAFGGDGGDSFGFDVNTPDLGGGVGGDATGGTALFNDTAGQLNFTTLTVNASGEGGDGGTSGFSGNAEEDGGDGGTGTGGSALISLNQDSSDPRSFSAIAQGLGGTGGRGNVGGAGGDGVGGIAEVAVNNVNVSFNQLTIDASAIGANAGVNAGSSITNGADGGSSQGGTARLAVNGVNGNFTAQGQINILAGAQGGVGGAGTVSVNDAEIGGNGGAGGSGTGGSATVEVSDGASIVFDADFITFNADSFGGTGGAGGDNTAFAQAGNGGDGGAGTGGTVGVVASTGATLDVFSASVPFTLSSTGFGGRGGDAGVGATNGVGGNGGVGTGGSPLVRAIGGTINIPDLEMIALGQGASAGNNTPNVFHECWNLHITSGRRFWRHSDYRGARRQPWYHQSGHCLDHCKWCH